MGSWPSLCVTEKTDTVVPLLMAVANITRLPNRKPTENVDRLFEVMVHGQTFFKKSVILKNVTV